MVPSDKPKNKFEHFQEEQKGIRDGNKKKKKLFTIGTWGKIEEKPIVCLCGSNEPV